MADKTPETKEERQARWWRDWWAADYSWDGLAKKDILGGGQWGEKTLQDYWRRDPDTGEIRTDEVLRRAGELVEFDNIRWHVAHHPLKPRSAAWTSWKAGPNDEKWVHLSAIISKRLVLAKETRGESGYSVSASAIVFTPSGADHRARLDGLVLRTLPPMTLPSEGDPGPIHICCENAAFLADLDFEGRSLGPGATFDRASFSGFAIFDRASFSEDAHFDSATFSGSVSFDSSTISGDARFDNATFSESASFHSATISRVAGFYRATFNGEAHFDSATFSGFVSFDSATFFGDASFDSATFSGGFSCYSATFSGYVGFERTTFSGGASFNSAIFSGDADFNSATFSGVASFDSATISGEANFHSATISGDARFDSATFSGIARFDGATISGDARFDSATFIGEAGFDGAAFSGYASFDGSHFAAAATFSSESLPDGSLKSTLFERYGTFRNAVFERQVTFSARVDQPEQGFAGAFYGARFADIADFSKSGPLRPGSTDRNDGARMAIAFAEALFEKTLILTDGSDAEAARAFRDGTMKVVQETPAGQARDDLLDRLEAGCRTVKIAMGKARDEVREQRYYRFQLQARHARKDTHPSEKFFGRLYGLVSDYGSSLGRPLILLFGLMAVSGFLYWLWAGSMNGTLSADLYALWQAPFSGDSWANPAAAMSFSAGRSLFLSAWPGAPEGAVAWQSVFLNGYGPGWSLLVRTVAAVQGILSGVLIFLFALAVRRRFQIGG